MKNLFLLFVCIVMLLVLKERQVNEVMERRDIQHTVLDFNGTLFLPRTLPFNERLVNEKQIEIQIDGKKYRYVEVQRIHWLVGKHPEEIRIHRGQTVRTSVPLKLFFSRVVQ